jgi:hypothetical protein
MPGVRRLVLPEGATMKKLTLRLIIALITFGVGVVATTLWLVRHSSPPQTPALITALSIARLDPLPAPAPDADQSEAAVTAGREALTASIEKEWQRLATTGFCFVGSQYYVPEREIDPSHPPRPGGEEAMWFSPYGWLPSAKRDEDAVIEFLINQITDKRKTRAHVCPLDNATRGELAVYCLQHLLKKNWPELSEDYSKLFERKAENVTSQSLLRGAIRSNKGAQKMMALWRDYYKNGKQE